MAVKDIIDAGVSTRGGSSVTVVSGKTATHELASSSLRVTGVMPGC